MQRSFPEIRRDKFEPGVELSKTEFEAAALVRPVRPDPLEGAEAAALFLELLGWTHPRSAPPDVLRMRMHYRMCILRMRMHYRMCIVRTTLSQECRGLCRRQAGARLPGS
jgi:hypothetical protein